MRHVSRTHRVALDWLFGRINLGPKIQTKHVDTQNQLADILTKGNFTRDEWNHLLCFVNIMNFSQFSCSHLSTFLSDPIRKQCAMSKRVQESNLKEGSAVATPKLVNVNLSSMRKIPSQGVSPARSWKQSAWATDDDPTMYSQERQQNDAQTSNTRKTGAKRRISSTPSWKESAQWRGPSLRKAEARIPKCADLQFSVFGESRQEHKKGESCRRCTTSGDPSTHNQHIDLGNVYVGINEGSDS